MSHGVILYGPPASGKDTVTQALTELDPTFWHFPPLKVGSGRSDGYQLIKEKEAGELRERGAILYESARYGNRYLVDQTRLDAALRSGHIPVLHAGQVSAVRAVSSYPAYWLCVLLWCSREVAKRRALHRGGSTDIELRMLAWDETARDIEEHGAYDFMLRIDTEHYRPEDSARLIRQASMGLAR